MRYPDWPVGRVAHAEDCKSLYIGSIPVPASKISFNTALFRLSSAVEQSAVNRSVACSNQAAGAIKKDPFLVKGFFLCFYCLIRAAFHRSLFKTKSHCFTLHKFQHLCSQSSPIIRPLLNQILRL